jgi:septum formation protein
MNQRQRPLSEESPVKSIFKNLEPLILASESPRRIRLLRSLGLAFEVIPSGIEERDDLKKEPGGLVECHAREKARTISRLYPKSWVLSADTIVVLDDRIFGKPLSADHALDMLQQLSGREHHVFSGLCLMRSDPKFLRVGCVRTKVRFKTLSPAEIRAYVETGEPLDKAGAYGIQELGVFLVESLQGSYTNVVGLPLCETLEWLLEQGIIAVGRDGAGPD